ncbi:DUF6292 family protein [Longimycelium tulufanense]|uniref:DUF6292 family protein n=1 Tax=Longimycelium tulufanense TaxID=907463 RepID=UPI00166E96B2|nr:DUF6292 family protein [Longimycelium tulufanense]
MAEHAVDADDCQQLLAMLGLQAVDGRRNLTSTGTDSPDTTVDGTAALQRGLAAYLHAVAAAVGVPSEGTSFEVSDTATAYLALTRRWPQRPNDDLMLVWSERNGWIVSVETDPGEETIVVACLGGTDPVPDPRAVARFVTDVIAGFQAERTPPKFPTDENRHHLAERLVRYVASS